MSRESKDGLGLGKLGGFDLAAMLEPAESRFLEVDIGMIREDGENPRRNFDPATLGEMAETIRDRGVITPISVRPDPEKPGWYIVNHGHRRLRAAKLAGLPVIPAVLDASFRDEDRIIENIQRDNLDMFEVAGFIGKKLAEGLKQKEVARLVGKSTAYVSQHAQLLTLPSHTRRAVKTGRLTDLTSIADLAKLERQDPDAVEHFLVGDAEVTRSAVRKYRETRPIDGSVGGAERLSTLHQASEETKTAGTADGFGNRPQVSSETSDNINSGNPTVKNGDESQVRGWRGGLVVVEMAGRRGVLRLDRRPRDPEHVWVEWDDPEKSTGQVAVARLALRAVVAG